MLHQSMKVFCLLVMIFVGALALNAVPARALQDVSDENRPGVVGEIPGAPVSYCHINFPAIEEGTIGSDEPRLQDSTSGDLIDYYGPCDHDPLGAEEVERQMMLDGRDVD
jgi:hypothetical protein